MKPLQSHILEKLKVSAGAGVKTFDEFTKTRKSLNSPENNIKLSWNNQDKFIDFCERNLVEDGVVDMLPMLDYFKENNLGEHIFRFDGHDMYDNIIDTRVSYICDDVFPPKFGTGYLEVVKFVIKNYQDECTIFVTEN